MILENLTKQAAMGIRHLAEPYMWWPAIESEGHPFERLVAQIMRYGTYGDVRKLESFVEPDVLAEVMINSAPGWFDDRTWCFWRGRLLASGQTGIAEQRPVRSFGHDPVL